MHSSILRDKSPVDGEPFPPLLLTSDWETPRIRRRFPISIVPFPAVREAASPRESDLVAATSTVSTASLPCSGERLVYFRLDSGRSHAQDGFVAETFWAFLGDRQQALPK
jgi:hypothetical protein